MRIVHNSLHDEVAAQLPDRIFAGELLPGMFLDEAQLTAQMRISRTALREALKVLTAEGLVRHEPRRNCFVNEVTEQELSEFFSVIALLEGQCARDPDGAEAAMHFHLTRQRTALRELARSSRSRCST